MITDGHDAIACRTHCYASADNENLKFIVEAVNNHEALKQENAELKALADKIKGMLVIALHHLPISDETQETAKTLHKIAKDIGGE